MTRPRLILAIVPAVLFGAAWWLSLDRLSAKERLLVGKWTLDDNSGTAKSQMRLRTDRRFAYGSIQDGGTASIYVWGKRWFVQDGAVFVDSEPSAIRRAVRPILRGVGLPVGGTISYPIVSITADELVLVLPDGTRPTWTRVPAD